MAGEQCKLCNHYSESDDKTCDAFEGGIPATIWDDKVSHTHRMFGDQGVRYESETENPLKKRIDAERKKSKPKPSREQVKPPMGALKRADSPTNTE